MAFVWQSGAKLARNDNSDTEKLLLPWSFAILSLSFVGDLSFNEEEGEGRGCCRYGYPCNTEALLTLFSRGFLS